MTSSANCSVMDTLVEGIPMLCEDDEYQELLDKPLISLLKELMDSFKKKIYEKLAIPARILKERSWEMLHLGDWKKVAMVWRNTYGVSCIFLCFHFCNQGEWIQALEELDMGLLMGGPRHANIIHVLVERLQRMILRTQLNRNWEIDLGGNNGNDDVLVGAAGSLPHRRIPRIAMPSLARFQDIMQKSEVVILTDAMTTWPAMGGVDEFRSWKNMQYLRQIAGLRTVPVEIGANYLDDTWSQKLMTFNHFLDHFMTSQDDTPNKKIGYLAQHQLFEQIPQLRRDILVPDYCALTTSDDDNDVIINAWFGPKGTISPLHNDPYHNLLCQIVGSKYIRIYKFKDTESLYPVDGMLSNTSQVQVEDPDYEKFPKFKDVEYQECILGEGEMIYIPPKYWHYIRSCSISFSTSFWWT